MASEWLIDKITALVEPVVTGMQLELVEVQFRREPVGQVLRLIIDSPHGLGIDQCAEVSREVGHLLEVEDLIDQAYHLEISSPGLDRPLTSERDFERCKGRKVSVKVRVDGGIADYTGTIGGCVDGVLLLRTAAEEMSIPIEKIKKAVQVIEF